MVDNIKELLQNVDIILDPNKGEGEVLVSEHNSLFKEAVNKLGRLTGLPFLSTGDANIESGSLSWGGVSMDTTTNFTLTIHSITQDGNNFEPVLSNLNQGDLIHFKDYEGRSALLEFDSYTSAQNASSETIFQLTVKGFAENPAFVYDIEEEDCLLSIIKQSDAIHYTSQKPCIWKKPGNANNAGLEVGDYVKTFIDASTVIEGFYLGGSITDIASYDVRVTQKI